MTFRYPFFCLTLYDSHVHVHKPLHDIWVYYGYIYFIIISPAAWCNEMHHISAHYGTNEQFRGPTKSQLNHL